MLSGRGKTILLLILAPIAIYVGILNLVDRANWKQPYDGLKLVQGPAGAEVKERGSANLPAGIEPGDVLIDINGLSIRTLDDHIEVMEVLAQTGPGGTTADYTFKQPGTREERTYPVSVELKSSFTERDVPLVPVAFLFLGIGVFIFLRNWKATGAFHFALICLTAFALLLFRHTGRADPFDIAIYWIDTVALLLLPALFLHFSSYFPEPMDWIRRHSTTQVLFYLPGAALLALHLMWFLGQLRLMGLPRTLETGFLLDKVELAHFLILFTVSVVLLFFAEQNASSSERRKQMKWITTGTVLGIAPFAAFYALPYFFDLPITTWMVASVLSLGLIPLTYGYAITKYRLMDVDLIFKKGATYVLASSTLLAFYVGIALLMGKAVQNLSSGSGFLLLAATALAVSFLFAPLRDRIQEQLDRRFYRERYSYRRSFLEFGQTLGSEINLPRLTDRIADRIQKTLDVSPVTIFLKSESSKDSFWLETSRGFTSDLESPLINISEDILFEMAPAAGFSHFDAARSEVKAFRLKLAEMSISYVEPLKVRARVIGFLGLGRRRNGDLLTSEDLEMVATLAGYAAIALDNALLYRSLEKKASELAQLQLYSENVIESINLGVGVISPEGEVTVWNTAMSSLTQIQRSAAVGRTISDILPEGAVAAMREIIDGPGWLVQELRYLYKTHIDFGEEDIRLFNITMSPFFSQEDVHTGTLIIFDEITERVRLEGQLQQAEKLSSIGLFAAGLAHEVNTPLAGISSYSQMLIKELRSDDPQRELLEKIEKQSFRASEIINNLLKFARFSPTEFQELSLNSLMIDTLSLLEHQFKKSAIAIELDLEPALPKTVGNGGKLQQVFMNLFLNAKDAMPDGGSLKLKTFFQDSELVVRVSDTGVGISKDEVKKIYDPFFTTKSVGKGTGLGLSVSYGIIQEHSGRIAVESQPGEGTTFSLYFPVRRVN
jgi:signal transduction histidine kinase